MKSPRPISIAAAMPVPVAASTTAGGGTRSGSNASTTAWASGRKTASQTSSFDPFARAFRELRNVGRDMQRQ